MDNKESVPTSSYSKAVLDKIHQREERRKRARVHRCFVELGEYVVLNTGALVAQAYHFITEEVVLAVCAWTAIHLIAMIKTMWEVDL